MINATNTGGQNFPIIPAGTYAARCFSMVHIGTVPELYMGAEKQMNKVRITWELPTETIETEKGIKVRTVGKEFTLSMHEKANLRKFLEGWRGQGFTDDEAKIFDITKLLGKTCLISIIHKTSDGGKEYANISSISTLPKGMTCPEPVNEIFEFNYDNFTWEKFNAIPDYLKDKIRKSKEFQAIEHPEHTQDEERLPEGDKNGKDLPGIDPEKSDLPF